jgi:hypothetical protein
MNRILKRPMFKMGGSTGTGITSGLDQPQKMANGGRTGYMNGTNPYAMGSFQATGLPGFLTQFGLNLLSTPPQGNIFATAATAARDPFAALQASQVESMKTASDRKFARELAAEEREFEEGQLEKKLAAQKELAGMDTTKTKENLLKKYDNNEIKAQREQDFYATEFDNLRGVYGDESVAIETIDSSQYQKKGSLEKYVKQNPQVARQVIYDVATGKAMRIVKDQTGKFKLVPADSADIDTTGEAMPAPDRTPGLFGQETKPNIVGPAIERLGEEFSDDFYQGG